MSDLIGFITQDLAGTQTTDLHALVHALDGNVSATARALRVPRGTLRRWLAGSTPKRSARSVTAAARGALTTIRRPGHYNAAYNGTRTLRISGTIRVSRDVRHRVINVGAHIPQALMKRALTAWSTADDHRAATIIHNAINKYYLDANMDIDGAWFE